MRKRISPLQTFLRRESSGGILLLIAAAMGIGVANSPLQASYYSILEKGFEVGNDSFYLKLTILKIINYVLMTIFFFIVGLEIKRELTSGHLSTFRSAVMPFLGALGGMAFPAGIYLLIAHGTDRRGWGVPVATDIALAVGLLTIIGKSVAPSLRTFLLGLAVIDDIGAILIIAFIYSEGIGFIWVASAATVILFIVVTKKFGVTSRIPYVVFGVLLWYFIYRSGIHATLSGVILGLLTPNISTIKESAELRNIEHVSLIERLEEILHPWSSFLIVPIFAFANTGVVISKHSIQMALESPIAWGIFFGLVLGKPLGIICSLVLAKISDIGDYPGGARLQGIFATGSAAGIGFTVAIFIANLAFVDKSTQDLAVIAVIVASLVSGLISAFVFAITKKANS